MRRTLRRLVGLIHRALRLTWVWATLLGVAVGITMVLIVWRLPVWLSQDALREYAGRPRMTTAEWLTAVNATRMSVVVLVAGLAALLTLVYTVRNYALSRTGQVTDRFTKAVEQLGSKELPVRIGGVFALERILRDSRFDRPTVVEVLSAFVRNGGGTQVDDLSASGPAADVEAALTVLGRRGAHRHGHERPLDLRSADLRGVDLPNLDLSGAHLEGACLDGARLIEANLEGAWLRDASLREATLAGANLLDADLTSADLQGLDVHNAKVIEEAFAETQKSGLKNLALAQRYSGPGGRRQRL